MSGTRVTVLVENTAGRSGLLAEHGLAFLVERAGRRFLFDTGQTEVACRNAAALGIDLGGLDGIVLSHGHYDHGGGLPAMIERYGPAPLFAHPDALNPCYRRCADGSSRPVGLSGAALDAARACGELEAIDRARVLAGGLNVTGPVPRVEAFETAESGFFKDPECRIANDLVEDQALFFDTKRGTVVLLGCAHAGVVNTLHRVRQLTGRKPLHVVAGGMHLAAADAACVDATVDALRSFDIDRLYPLHCTGFAASARLWNELPARVSDAPAGTVLEF